MVRRFLTGSMVIAWVLLPINPAVAQTPSQAELTEDFVVCDTGNDGLLDEAEYLACHRRNWSFSDADQNADGFIDLDEYLCMWHCT